MTGVDGFAVVGEVLAGKYRVDKILGIGGMGMVVAATHLEIDQRVALKFMLPSAHDSPEMAARFLREARAAGRLNSEHVCRVMDVGRFESGAPYIVMEYLHGENLASRLRRHGPLRVSDAVDVVLQAIEGLAEAHAHGIVHRDLKPDNLFLAKRNDGAVTVKVLDFGISKVAVTGVVTGTGDIMGSPAYMAPEQMQASRDVDQRADVWSLGVVLYQIVVGKLPFHGDSLPLLCMHVVNDAPMPMSEVRGDLPDGFEAVVMRCLGKEPGERYADVGELAEALVGFGPKHATTSVSRIQSVLARSRGDGAATLSHEFSTIAPTLDHDPAVLAALGVAPAPAALPATQRPTGPQGTSPGPQGGASPSTQLGPQGGPSTQRAAGGALPSAQRATVASGSQGSQSARSVARETSPPVGSLPSSQRPAALSGPPLLPSSQRVVQSTTLASTSGQALGPLRPPTRSWGMIGAIAGGVGLVAVLVAILARSGVAPDAVIEGPHATTTPSQGAAKPVSAPEPPAAMPTMTVEAIEPATVDGGSAEPVAVPAPSAVDASETHAIAAVDAGAALDHPVRKKRPRRTKAGAAPTDAVDGATAGSDPDDDDVWTHMTHDGKAQ